MTNDIMTTFDKILYGIKNTIGFDINKNSISGYTHIILDVILAISLLILIIINVRLIYKLKMNSTVNKYKDKYSMISKNSPEIYYEYIEREDCIYFTEKCRELLGVPPVLQRFFLRAKNADNCASQLAEFIAECVKEEKNNNIKVSDFVINSAMGIKIHIKMTGVKSCDKNNTNVKVIGKIIDIDNYLLYKGKNQLDNMYDSETHMLNYLPYRFAVNKYLMVKSNDTPCSLILIRIINYNSPKYSAESQNVKCSINKSVIYEMAQIINKKFRKDDKQGRWSDDTLSVFIENTAMFDIEDRMRMVLEELNRTLKLYRAEKIIKINIAIITGKNDIMLNKMITSAEKLFTEMKNDGSEIKTYNHK